MPFFAIPFTEKVSVLKLSPGCVPIVTKNLSVFTNLYRYQKRDDHGLPSSATRNCGSKKSLLFPIDRSRMVAGLSNVKVGINEIPLLVTVTAPLT